MSADDVREEVLAAADRLVAAFARTDTETYFACFAPEATFVFHTTAEVLPARADYRRLWGDWLAEGFRVHDCRSSGRAVAVHGAGDVAVFTHRVRTEATVAGERTTSHERETIVFARRDGGWLAVHEHLSPDPGEDPPGPA